MDGMDGWIDRLIDSQVKVRQTHSLSPFCRSNSMLCCCGAVRKSPFLGDREGSVEVPNKEFVLLLSLLSLSSLAPTTSTIYSFVPFNCSIKN